MAAKVKQTQYIQGVFSNTQITRSKKLSLRGTAQREERYMKVKYRLETVLYCLIYFIDCIERFYEKYYLMFAIPIGFILVIGFAGGAEGNITDDYFQVIRKVIVAFIISALIWRIEVLKRKDKTQ